MEFIELKNIERKDSLIHYINKYHALLVYKSDNIINESMIEIILEKTAFGTTNIQFSISNDELKDRSKEIEQFINEKNKSGLFS